VLLAIALAVSILTRPDVAGSPLSFQQETDR
jgi:hypothetical protein